MKKCKPLKNNILSVNFFAKKNRQRSHAADGQTIVGWVRPTHQY
ncbi:hypothetical protein [Microscilla marina]|uniref:Uncharacterized protein n=1 Tax=Microscilla marina ATCC 23134 TaxID=313606 RepID=A1ZFC4_MICM2|nr:hypothetical protein [Microscilla marina]EAY30698.1 hypothetical protein M23134_01022 [Microscilla marina ATCC 23134]